MSADLINAVYASGARPRMDNGRMRHYDGDDAVQEAAIDAWKYGAALSSVRSTAYTLVRHSYLAALTRETRIKRGGGEVGRLVDTATGAPLDVALEERDPLASLCDAESAVELWEVVAALPGRQGEAVALRYREDLTVAEIGARMSLSIEAVGGLLKRGLKALRDRMAA